MIETNLVAYRRAQLNKAMEPASLRGAWLGIDLVGLAENIAAIKRLLRPETRLMAVVKADGYGHGAQSIAEAALQSGASHVGVATVEEGVRLRRAGIKAPILVLGLIPDAAAQAAVEANLHLTISSFRQAKVLERVGAGLRKIPDVHLKVNTGMTRIGCEPHEAPNLAQYVLASPSIRLVGLSSHFASAESDNTAEIALQIKRFAELDAFLKLQAPKVIRHLANSAGTLYWPEAHHDLVRVGLALYGHSPRGREAAPIALSPIMSLRARLSQIKDVPAGASVGYGSTWKSTVPTRLGLLPVGYADGLPRSLSNVGSALVRGRRCPIVGRISMDQAVIDLGNLPVEPGEEALLLGGHGASSISVEEWAEADGTVSWEILCALGQRLPRVYYK